MLGAAGSLQDSANAASASSPNGGAVLLILRSTVHRFSHLHVLFHPDGSPARRLCMPGTRLIASAACSPACVLSWVWFASCPNSKTSDCHMETRKCREQVQRALAGRTPAAVPWLSTTRALSGCQRQDCEPFLGAAPDLNKVAHSGMASFGCRLPSHSATLLARIGPAVGFFLLQVPLTSGRYGKKVPARSRFAHLCLPAPFGVFNAGPPVGKEMRCARF
jgi:hypothetical protein